MAIAVLFLVDRSRRQGDRYLEWKVRLFAIGATLGLAGIFLDMKSLVWAAIVVLVAGFLLRFVRAAPEGGSPDPPDEARGIQPDMARADESVSRPLEEPLRRPRSESDEG